MTGRRLIPVHPVPMRTVFRQCFLVNFALRPDALAARLPPHLKPDVLHDRAFLSIVIARMERMRPAFLPRFLGTTYVQVVYRAVVRCGGERGVCFLRSDADHRLMVLGGNALTFFKFHRADVTWREEAGLTRFSLVPANGDAASIRAEFDIGGAGLEMPQGSRFRTLTEAQEGLTELFVAFGPREHQGKVDAVRIRRSSWHGLVVHDRVAEYEAMTSGLLFSPAEAVVDSVFYVESLDYFWDRKTWVHSAETSDPAPHR